MRLVLMPRRRISLRRIWVSPALREHRLIPMLCPPAPLRSEQRLSRGLHRFRTRRLPTEPQRTLPRQDFSRSQPRLAPRSSRISVHSLRRRFLVSLSVLRTVLVVRAERCSPIPSSPVTARGSFTTTTVQFFGGLTTSDLTVTGTASLQNTTATNLAATGLLSFTSATGTSLNSNNAAIGILSFGSATGSTLNANFASFASATVAGQGICLQNGVGCPSASAEADTLASVTNRGAFATSSVTLFGGLTASNFTATGTTSLQSTTATNLAATGLLSFTSATGTTLRANTATIGLLTYGNATGATLNANVISAVTVTSTAMFVNGVAVCLANGTNCSTAGLDTLQSVTARGSFTTTTAQFFGGLSASNITATGTTSLQNTTATNLASTGLLSFVSATGSTLNANFASFASATVAGQGICLQNGVGCPSAAAEADTLASVTNRGAFATSSVTLFGGLATSNLTATGTLSVTGVSSLAGVTFTNATGTNATTTNFFATNLGFSSATGVTLDFQQPYGKHRFFYDGYGCRNRGMSC
jgi:hypothetical protein